MNKPLKIGLFLTGFAIGVWHHVVGMTSIFVFKGTESLFVWLAMILGPLSTLPAVIVSWFRPKIGGYWLVGGALVCVLSIGIGEELTLKQMGIWFLKVSAPMLAIGVGFFLLMKWSALKLQYDPEGK